MIVMLCVSVEGIVLIVFLVYIVLNFIVYSFLLGVIRWLVIYYKLIEWMDLNVFFVFIDRLVVF